MHVCEPNSPCLSYRESLEDCEAPSCVCVQTGHEKSFSARSDWTNAHENHCAIGARTACACHLDADHPLRASEA